MQGKNKNLGADANDPSAQLNWLMVIPEAWCISINVFLHRHFGARYFGLQAAAVLLLIPCYCGLWPHADLRPMLIFLLAYVVMCVVARVCMGIRRLRGETPQHSRYCGYPVLMKFLPFLSEVTVKRFIEPLLVFLGGVFMLPLNQPLALYWMIGAACMGGMVSSAVGFGQRQAMDMHDSVIDQQELAERFRGMRGDDF
jgi:hypothetical protein